MYTYIVDRTQIYLTSDESTALERASIATGKTKSQLIREAIDEKFLAPARTREERLRILHETAGAWKEAPGEDRSAYLRASRRADVRRQTRLERLRRSPIEGPDAAHPR